MWVKSFSEAKEASKIKVWGVYGVAFVRVRVKKNVIDNTCHIPLKLVYYVYR